MSIEEYVERMKDIEDKFLNYLTNEDNEEENYYIFFKILDDKNIFSDCHNLKSLLYLLSNVSNNHHRNCNFFAKIEQTLIKFKEEIKTHYSNFEIFKIFKKNKRILLFLIEEKILYIDKYIAKEMMKLKFRSRKYPEYFSHEIKWFIEEQLEQQQAKSKNFKDKSSFCFVYEQIKENLKQNFDFFNEKRKNGENDGYLCQIIQKDLIEEFITYVNKEDYPLSSYIEESIFETNPFLLEKNKITLIEYATFFGSIQIFNYLYKNGVLLTESLRIYAIHGENEEIIHILEEKLILKKNPFKTVNLKDSYEKCLIESIKCHHNNIANYIQLNFLNDKNSPRIQPFIFHYYNFLYFPNKMKNKKVFFYSCKYDYFIIVQLLLKSKSININSRLI